MYIGNSDLPQDTHARLYRLSTGFLLYISWAFLAVFCLLVCLFVFSWEEGRFDLHLWRILYDDTRKRCVRQAATHPLHL